MLNNGFWDNQVTAQKTVQRVANLRDKVSAFQELVKKYEEKTLTTISTYQLKKGYD